MAIGLFAFCSAVCKAARYAVAPVGDDEVYGVSEARIETTFESWLGTYQYSTAGEPTLRNVQSNGCVMAPTLGVKTL